MFLEKEGMCVNCQDGVNPGYAMKALESMTLL